jgi:hypothetical protein
MPRSRVLVRSTLFLLVLAAACAEPATGPERSAAIDAPSFAVATTGDWTLYPAQPAIYRTAVQQPINPDGSSSFRANGNGVIPVKFGLLAGTGPATFESILSDAASGNDFSYLSFTPSAALTFADITTLSAEYTFTLGDCHLGALRWSVTTSSGHSLFIYYGALPNFTDCTTASQSGQNMVGLSDLRYDTSQYPGGTFYDSYDHALTLMGSETVAGVSLVLDGGSAGDQRLTLGGAAVHDNVFTPAPAAGPSPTCELPPAAVRIVKTAGAASGPVNEPVSIQPSDDDLTFRTLDCKYVYNLATRSLSGTGSYLVSAVIGGNEAAGAAGFDLR